MSRPTVPPESWEPARRAAQAIVSPIQRILAIEAASGVLLLLAAAVALTWANAAHASYTALWQMPIGVSVGDHRFERSALFWINDGLMTIFFLVVGLEIRREIFEGQLRTLKLAALPLVAALGGMLVPAAIYGVLNAGRSGSPGWAIPMATDIAFAVGILALLGDRVPHAWRVLLLALAVIDDIGAILVIAVLFHAGLALDGLVLALVGLGGVFALRGSAMRSPFAYVVPGILLWAGLYRAGIHPTLAGVMLGLLTPARSWLGVSGFAETTKHSLENLEASDHATVFGQLDEIRKARREAVSPVEWLIHTLHPWVAFGVMPLFALANAGVVIGGVDLTGDRRWMFVGIVIALVIGKPLGIAGAALFASKARIATRSAEMRPGGIVLVGMVGGIGFTMSLFIASLAFPHDGLGEAAKLGILVGSGLAMTIGLVWGAIAVRRKDPGADTSSSPDRGRFRAHARTGSDRHLLCPRRARRVCPSRAVASPTGHAATTRSPS